jgi:hypothetical protein
MPRTDVSRHPHIAAIKAAFPGAPEDVIASWLIDLADDFGSPGPSWLEHIGGTFDIWSRARWSRRRVGVLELSSGSRSVILELLGQFRAGSKLTTRNGRARVESLVAYVGDNKVLPYAPTAAAILGSELALMDGTHRWVAWAHVIGPVPVECCVATF